MDVGNQEWFTFQEDPAAQIFFIGKIDIQSEKVIINKEKVKFLKGRITENLKACKNCFLKYNCAGDCLAKTFRSCGGDIFSPDPHRCQIANLINKQLIAWIADGVIEPRIADKYSVVKYNCQRQEESLL